MLHYYLLLFFRNIKRQKLFSFINLFGLTISITSTLLIYLYVQHEFSYDRFHPHADRIYRVNQTFIWGENSNNQFASTGPGVAHAIKEELPEVELITSINTPGNFIISYTNLAKEIKSFEEDRILAADSNFFKMFNFPMIKGNVETALRQAQTLVMTESTAKKYFGDEDPIGKLVRLGEGENQNTYEVTGIVRDTPENSYIEFNVLLSMSSIPAVERLHWSWIWTQLETYVRLSENANLDNTLAKLQLIPRKHAEETLQRIMNTSFDEYIKSGKKWELFLQPMTSIHLPSTVVFNRLNDSGNIKIIYSLIGAGIFVVLLSCVNFMNLSTAQFTRRIKEASIRKVLGLNRLDLGLGYFMEALIFCTIALVTAFALTQALLPVFNMLIGKTLEINIWSDFTFLFGVLGLIILMSVVSGFYPAMFLSAFHPVEAMKGKVRTGGTKFRNGLVVFQFAVSIILIVCTAIVFQQLDFVSKKDLGFEKENLMVLAHVEALKDGETLTNAALNIPGVVNATWCTSVPPTVWGGDKFSAEGMNDQNFSLNYTTADESFISTLGIKLKLGRNFSKDAPGDINRVILNETAIRQIGWRVDDSVIGRKIQIPGGEIQFEVVGVVDDFHYWSLATPIEPMGIFSIRNKDIPGTGNKQYLALRIASQDNEAWETTIAGLNKLWKEQAGDTPFQYQFVDQAFAETFKSQQQFGNALTVLAGLAIIIACLGLLGMIIYTLEQRTKEIGIRKVSGASAWNILVLISRGYSKLIVVAFVVGSPIAYWIMQQWLQDFAFRVVPSFWVFAMAGLGTLLIAILITIYHSMKAAHTNPIDVLKDE